MKIRNLQALGACDEAVEWAGKQESAATAWRDCQRGDWMLWLLGKLSGKPDSVKRRKLVLCACECARLSLKYVKRGEERPRIAIETAEKWARGDGPTLDDVRAAADAAYADAAAAYAADAAAAYAAADAADAAYADADAAYAAANAAAYAAAADAARTKTLAVCADIVRKHYPKAPRIAGVK